MKSRSVRILASVAAALIWSVMHSAIAATPTANAGTDQTVAAGADCKATVTLTGTGTDPDGTAVTLGWAWTTADGDNTANGAAPSIVLGLGTTVVTLTVTDAAGETATDTVSIIVEDQTPPEVTLTASPKVLWPPNHKMVPVTVTATATDNCAGTNEEVSSIITSVTSNEPDNDNGDGNTTGDFEITGDLTVNLRAERAGPGSGRIYTITVESTDADGNVAESTVLVRVPHDMGGDDDDDDDDEDGIKVGDFTTYAQDSWGAPASGENAGAYRDEKFTRVFPEGLTIGAGAAEISGSSITFTSTESIEAFLPQIGVPAALALDHTDPETTEAGELAGQVLALTLNVKFDLADKKFSQSKTNLADLLFAMEGSPCDGKSVEEILLLANTVLGGGTSEVGAADLNDCLTLINGNFEGGLIDGGFLILPESTVTDEEWDECKKAQKEKKGKTFEKLKKLFDKNKDGKLKGKEKSKLRKAYKEHVKKEKKNKKASKK